MAEDTKSRIMTASADLFRKRGVRDVTIDDVCRQVGISKKTFYQFYSQKQDLVYEVASALIEDKRHYFEDLFDGLNPPEVIATMSRLIRRKSSMSGDTRMASDIRKYYPETFMAITREREDAAREALLAFFRKGVDEGFFRPEMDLDAHLLLLGLMHKGMVFYFEDEDGCSGKRLSRRRVAAAFTDIACRTLLTEKGWEEFEKTNERNDE